MGTKISNGKLVFTGIQIGIAKTFFYSFLFMVYAIIRSSFFINTSLAGKAKSNILFSNGFALAYTISVFAILTGIISALIGALTILIIKKILLYFNPELLSFKAISIGIIWSLFSLIIFYHILYTASANRFSFAYPQTFLFWFILPVCIYLAAYIIGSKKLNDLIINKSATVNDR